MSSDQNRVLYQGFNNRWNLQLPLPLLIEALTHPSYKAMDPTVRDNQRLETLGDSVIDLLVIEWLYHQNVETEGILTKKRASVVQNKTLTQVGTYLQIETVLRCAQAYQIQEKDLADSVEAIFGAIYLANGLEACRTLLMQLFEKHLKKVLVTEIDEANNNQINENNPKNLVQEFFHKKNSPNPIYQLLKVEGLDHKPQYWFSCKGTYQNQTFEGNGQGRTKKEAQKNAAYDLYRQLQHYENKRHK